MTTTNYDPRVLKAPHPVPGAPDNWKRFFSFNTDAKVIGIQYIATGLFFLLVGGLLASGPLAGFCQNSKTVLS